LQKKVKVLSKKKVCFAFKNKELQKKNKSIEENFLFICIQK